MADYLLTHGEDAFNQKYYRVFDRTGIIYDEPIDDGKLIKKVNPFMYAKKKLDIKRLKDMKLWGDNRYNKELADILGQYNPYTDMFFYNVIYRDYSLEKYLEDMVNKILFSQSDRKELIEKINARRNGKLLKSINTLNSVLSEKGFHFIINKIKAKKVINGKIKYFNNAWQIVRSI